MITVRKPLKRTLFLSLVLWIGAGIGCAGQETAPVETAEEVGPSEEDHRLEQLDQQNDHLASRVRELESSLHLARAEARDLRESESRRADGPSREVVRLGHHTAAVTSADAANLGGWDEPEDSPRSDSRQGEGRGSRTDGATAESGAAWDVPVDDGRARPVLRLYGSPAASLDTSTPLVIPPAPPGMPTTLPIAAIPEPSAALMATRSHSRSAAPATRRADQAAVSAYQLALTHVRDRRFSEALRSFDAFLTAHPRHPYAASAVYWQGEVYYAMRDYGHALTRFSRVVDDYPRATKVADSLFKLGMCHKRMGRSRAARQFFERVRRQYPESVAARLSVQEDA